MGSLSINHLGAIGLAAMIFNFFFWNFGFLRMGTTGMVAQAYGADDKSEQQQLLSKGIIVALGLALLILLLQKPIGHISLYLLGVGSEHAGLVWDYYNIRVWSAPATLVTYCLFGWFFGMQNSVIPLVATIVTNVSNIIISYYFVVILQWDIKGVAFGTVLAEYLGVLILLAFLYKRYDFKIFTLPELFGWSNFFSVNRDLFFRTIALTSAFAFFYRQSSLSGELILAVNVVLLQFLSWMSYAIDGFAYASESLVGRFVGQRNRPSLLKSIKLSFLWAGALALGFSMIFGIHHTSIASIFSDNPQVVEAISRYRIWLTILPLVAFTCYIWDGIFIGFTASKFMRNSMIWSLILYICAYFILQHYSENAIWISFALFLGVRGLILSYIWLANRHNLFDLHHI